jgi:hypothetical protein
MGTKNNPGKFDCYENAKPDEPVFILLGRDPVACAVVHFWAILREQVAGRNGAGNLSTGDQEQIHEARECALAMAQYAKDLGKEKPVVTALEYTAELFK